MAGLNNSIFDLPHSLEELRRPEDVIKVSTRKIIPRAASKGGDFPGSDITFDFVLAGNQHWIPSRSYVVLRDSIYVGDSNTDPVQPNINALGNAAADVAPAMNCQDNLWDGVQLTVGGFSLGSRTKLAPQISACEKRIMKSASWLDGAGKSSQCFEPSFFKRREDILAQGRIEDGTNVRREQLTGTVTIVNNSEALAGVNTLFLTELREGDQIITQDNIAANVVQVLTVLQITTNTAATVTSDVHIAQGAGTLYNFYGPSKKSAQANKNERLYQPPLGVFKQGKALPPARYELILRPKPDTVYKQSALESKVNNLVIAGGARDTAGDLTEGEYEYIVDNIVFFLAVVDNYERVADQMSYVLDLEETEVLPRQIPGNMPTTENFTVSKSTFGLSVALQDNRAGRNTLFSPSLFKTENNSQQSLTSLRLDYAGQSRPQPDAQPSFIAGTDHETYRWSESAIEDLAYYDTGGVLTKDDWRELGELYHFQWRKVGDDISTNVDVSVTYGAFTNGPHNLLLFHHFRRVIEMQIESGQVTNFLAQDA